MGNVIDEFDVAGVRMRIDRFRMGVDEKKLIVK